MPAVMGIRRGGGDGNFGAGSLLWDRTMKISEIINEPRAIGGKVIKCLKCRLTSYNPNDVEYRYCGYCHCYLEEADPALVRDATLEAWARSKGTGGSGVSGG